MVLRVAGGKVRGRYELACLRFFDAWPLDVVRRVRGSNEDGYWFAPEASSVVAPTLAGPTPAGVPHLCTACGSPVTTDAFGGLVSL